MIPIEFMLSARLFIAPRLVGDRIFFLSNLGQGGYLSLYAMDYGGSVPEPLLPPGIAVQNPDLVGGATFIVFSQLNQILLMLDHNGDENYQPMLLPIEGGVPRPAFGDALNDYRLHCYKHDVEHGIVYLHAESRNSPVNIGFQGDLNTGTLVKLGESEWNSAPVGVNATNTRVIMLDSYTVGDSTLYEWTTEHPERRLVYGVPLEDRTPGQEVPLNAFGAAFYTAGDKGLLLSTSLFEDTYGLGYLALDGSTEVVPVKISGQVHNGIGELTGVDQLHDNRYSVEYNIDGCSWLYEGTFDEAALELHLDQVLCGQGQLAGGKLESTFYDHAGDRYALAFSTATSPCQIYTIESDHSTLKTHTRERILGLAPELLSPGEDASFVSHDGLRVSARLYLPAPSLGFEGPYPLVYYIHGGPQGQERPDFTWFSMPLIQFLTLNGFAVFVPNARGSTGYGLSYTKHVDHDWGGQDRLDHAHAMTKILPQDSRIDVKRAGVVGRSYGGYMTLTQAMRHPDLWAAAVDMFGPYDLLSFMDRIPPTWKPYFAIAIGDPEKDRDFLLERSPRTYVDQLACPLLVIQGQNDPRVVERESRDVVEQLRGKGKQVEYLVFEDEGHDVLKFANRVRCYNAITDFFKANLAEK